MSGTDLYHTAPGHWSPSMQRDYYASAIATIEAGIADTHKPDMPFLRAVWETELARVKRLAVETGR